MMNGGRRIPCEAIVCATDAICSGLATTPPWPMPATPSDRSDGIWAGRRVVLSGTGADGTLDEGPTPNAADLQIGSSIARVLQVTIYVTDLADKPDFNRVW